MEAEARREEVTEGEALHVDMVEQGDSEAIPMVRTEDNIQLDHPKSRLNSIATTTSKVPTPSLIKT